MMAFCTQCGKQLDDATRFCPICGAPAAQDGPDTAQQTPPQQAAAPAGGQTWNQNPYVNPEQMDVNNNKGLRHTVLFLAARAHPDFCRERFQIRTLPRQPGAGAHDIRSDILGCRRDCDRDFYGDQLVARQHFQHDFRAGEHLLPRPLHSRHRLRGAGPVQDSSAYRKDQHSQVIILRYIKPLPKGRGFKLYMITDGPCGAGPQIPGRAAHRRASPLLERKRLLFPRRSGAADTA